jgi:hypothetical protein
MTMLARSLVPMASVCQAVCDDGALVALRMR